VTAVKQCDGDAEVAFIIRQQHEKIDNMLHSRVLFGWNGANIYLGRPCNGAHASHWPLCKPKDRTSDIYVQLVAFIERRFERPKATGEEKLDVLVEPNFCRRFL
jgi:hypothetical protein